MSKDSLGSRSEGCRGLRIPGSRASGHLGIVLFKLPSFYILESARNKGGNQHDPHIQLKANYNWYF